MNESFDDNEYKGADQESKFTVRALMTKEVGAIIGKKADNLRKVKQESGAKIFISDASFIERIVTIIGNIKSIDKAFELIIESLQKYGERAKKPMDGDGCISVNLIVQASQCGVIIGKGGNMIKELKNKSGANIRVAPELLPNSTERLVAITGNAETVPTGIHEVCLLLLKNLNRGKSGITYMPHTPSDGSANYTDYSMHDEFPKPGGGFDSNLMARMESARNNYTKNFYDSPAMEAEKTALSALGSSTLLNTNRSLSQIIKNQKMSIPAEFVSHLFGRDGKIEEIKRISRASISLLGDSEQRSSFGEPQKLVTLVGSPYAITIGKALINMSIDLQRVHLDEQDGVDNSELFGRQQQPIGSTDANSLSSTLPLLQLLAQPDIVNSLSALAKMGNSSTDTRSSLPYYGNSNPSSLLSNLSQFGNISSGLGNSNHLSSYLGGTGGDSRSVSGTGQFTGRSNFNRIHSPSNGKAKTRNSYSPY